METAQEIILSFSVSGGCLDSAVPAGCVLRAWNLNISHGLGSPLKKATEKGVRVTSAMALCGGEV